MGILRFRQVQKRKSCASVSSSVVLLGDIVARLGLVFGGATPAWSKTFARRSNHLRHTVLQNPLESRCILSGAVKGFQANGMVSILPSWAHNETGPIRPTRFNAEDLIAHVKANMEHQAVTTINIGIYQDCKIEQSSHDMMRPLRRAVRRN
jgi:hypothetical protein